MAAISERRGEFLSRVTALAKQVSQWAEEGGWATKPYPKKMRDADNQVYEAEALFLQKGPIRLLLDPVAYDVPGAEAVMDLALMPTYDDAASLYFENGAWSIHYAFQRGRDQPERIGAAEVVLLNKESINRVLDSIEAHAQPTF